MNDNGPHSRACGIRPHSHGFLCHKNCPTCNGSASYKENKMSDQSSGPSEIPGLNTDAIKEKAQQVYEQGTYKAKEALLNTGNPEIEQAVEKSKSFYEAHKKEVHLAIVGVVALRVYKRKVAKATAKAVIKAIASEKFDPIQTVPTMFNILDDLRRTPEMAYIPHGGGMVHLLGPTKDVIVTVFGNFDKMNTEEIFRYAGKALGMRGY